MRLSPVVLFVYNRPEHTAQALQALESADISNESTLYIYSDGPKEDASIKEKEKINEVREIIRQRKWCKNVYIKESEKNRGLADSIIMGVTEIVNNYGTVIVLEDDILVSVGFLRYCNEALNIYMHDEKVMHISCSMYNVVSDIEEETYFLNILSCHGWATWKRAWDYYNNDALDHLTYFQTDFKKSYTFDIEGNAYFLKQLQKNVTGDLKSWAVRWYASWLREGGTTLFPRKSLVRNIGFDGSGENTKYSKNYLAPQINYIKVEKKTIEESKSIRKDVSEFWGEYLKKVIDNDKPYWKKSLSYLFRLILPKGEKIVKRLIIKIYPSLLPILTTDNKVEWSGVISRIKGSWIHDTVKLYDPVQISWCRIGFRTYIGQHTYLSYTEIGKFCSIGPNVSAGWGIHPINGISTSPSFYSSNPANGYVLCNESKIIERKKITIGNDVFIGMNATILDGVKISDGAVIGAGCVVSKDVPPYAVVIGNPMRILRYRFNDDIIEKLLSIKWWDRSEEDLAEVENLFFDVEKYINKRICQK